MSENKDSREVATKACTKCGAVFPIDEFYRDKRAPSGRRPDCKECNKKRVRAWQYANHDRMLATAKARYSRPGQHERNLEHFKKSRARHPERDRARNRVRSAIKAGRLVRQPCMKCGKPNADAHHHDYSRPLDVEWLCSRCHGEEHRTTPEGIAARTKR